MAQYFEIDVVKHYKKTVIDIPRMKGTRFYINRQLR